MSASPLVGVLEFLVVPVLHAQHARVAHEGVLARERVPAHVVQELYARGGLV